MNNYYVASAHVRKHRCVARAGDSQHTLRVLEVKDSGKPVSHYGDAFNHRTLAEPGIAIGIATENAEPGKQVMIADSEGRVIVARVGVRLSEPILAIAMEGSAGSGSLVAVKIAPRGLRT